MDGKKEWFTLREVAELLQPTDTAGRVLVGNEAQEEVLKLVFRRLAGVQLQASCFLYSVQAKRWVAYHVPRKPGEHRDHPGNYSQWERFELTGLVHIRINPLTSQRQDNGLIQIPANDDDEDGCPAVSVLLSDNPRQKIRIAEQIVEQEEDYHVSVNYLEVAETDLVFTRAALADYARLRGLDDLLKRLEGVAAGDADVQQSVASLTPAAEVTQGKAKSKSKTGKTKKPRKDRSEFWDSVEQWVRNRRMSGQPGIDDFRQAVRKDPGYFAVDGRIDEHPSPDSDGKRFYYCLASGVEVPEGTVKNRISEFYGAITK